MFFRLVKKLKTGFQDPEKNTVKDNMYFKVRETPWLIISRRQDFAMV